MILKILLGVGPDFFFIFTEGHADLPKEAIGPKGVHSSILGNIYQVVIFQCYVITNMILYAKYKSFWKFTETSQ